MSGHIDKSWLVYRSIENDAHDRCVDLFRRTDGTFGFEEFRRDVEDAGEWTAVQSYSGTVYATGDATLNTAMTAVPWLGEAIRQQQSR